MATLTGTAALGYEVPGVKASALLVKLPHLTMEEFDRHWRHPHGTLTKRLPYFKRYVQNHALENPPETAGIARIPYDGVPTVWATAADDLAAATKDPRYAELDADVDKMYVRSKVVWLQGHEYVTCQSQSSADATPVKAMLLLRRDEAVGAAQFEKGLADALRVAKRSMPGLTSLTTMLLPPGGGAPYDAVIEIAFATEPAFRSAWSAHAEKVITAADLVSDIEQSGSYFAREDRVIWDR